MFFDEHDEWFDGFTDWEEVRPLLQDDWTIVRDARQRLEVRHGGDGLVVYEWPDGRLLARHRRGLHKLGFRSAQYSRLTAWGWDVGPALATSARSAHDDMLERYARLARPATVAALRHRLVGAELIAQQAQRVVHEVFRTQPCDLAVAVYRERDPWDEGWDDDEDETWPQPIC